MILPKEINIDFFSLTTVTDVSDLSNYCIYVIVKSTEQVKNQAAIIARAYSIYLNMISRSVLKSNTKIIFPNMFQTNTCKINLMQNVIFPTHIQVILFLLLLDRFVSNEKKENISNLSHITGNVSIIVLKFVTPLTAFLVYYRRKCVNFQLKKYKLFRNKKKNLRYFPLLENYKSH